MDNAAIARLEQFYLKSSAEEGWTSGKEMQQVEGFLGTWGYYNRDEDLEYYDRFGFNGGGYSFGQTVLTQMDVPVWVMSYEGWWNQNPEVLLFLKTVLKGTYDAGVFLGGRGFQNIWQAGDFQPGLLYRNHTEANRWGFRSFRGRESIRLWPNQTELVHWHNYRGLLLSGDGNPTVVSPGHDQFETLSKHAHKMQAAFQNRVTGVAQPQSP